ncbi:MAG: HTH domain-containing protein [DPANN group archaeon]|nr:HTH domain-containing protein [DPANN group archaeon]
MSQQDVYIFLSKNKRKWYTAKEIISALNLSTGSVTNSLKRLRETDQIKYRITKDKKTNKRSIYQYQFKK